jgi:hypothetical protein
MIRENNKARGNHEARKGRERRVKGTRGYIRNMKQGRLMPNSYV